MATRDDHPSDQTVIDITRQATRATKTDHRLSAVWSPLIFNSLNRAPSIPCLVPAAHPRAHDAFRSLPTPSKSQVFPRSPTISMTVSCAGTSSPRTVNPITFSCGGSLIQYVSNTNLCTIVYHVHSCVLVVLPAFEDERVSRDARRRTEVFERLQNHTQNSLFSPKAIYDSDAIAYSSTVLSFGNAATVSRSECW